MPAFTTPDPCKTIIKDAAIEVAGYNVFHIGPKKARLLCKPIIMNLFQSLKMILNTLIILGCLRVTWLRDSRFVWHGLSL